MKQMAMHEKNGLVGNSFVPSSTIFFPEKLKNLACSRGLSLSIACTVIVGSLANYIKVI
jgi:hypothetical protein